MLIKGLSKIHVLEYYIVYKIKHTGIFFSSPVVVFEH